MTNFVAVLAFGVIIYGLLAVFGFIWFYSDITERYGLTSGCLSIIIYFACIPFFPLLLIAYRLFTHFHERANSVRVIQEPKSYFAFQAIQRDATMEPDDALSPDILIGSQEQGPELDALIRRGELESALARAADLLETAQAFKDPKGIARFTKYVRVIRARVKK